MIKNIKFGNFKCFNDHTIPLNNLTILAGANATGKSSVVQGLLLYHYTETLADKLNNNLKESLLDINDALGIKIGSPKELVSHDTKGEDSNINIKVENQFGKNEFSYNINRHSPLEFSADIHSKEISESHFYQYLNAERIGPRQMNSVTASLKKLRNDGENVAYIIEQLDSNQFDIHQKLSESREQKFSEHVERWMDAILGELKLSITTDYSKSITEMRYTNDLVEFGVTPPLTGFGITYVLPIVTAGLLCSGRSDSKLIIENPEAHLHPYAQSNIGKFLALVAECGVQVIVETHSEHVIDGARLQLAHNENTDIMTINFFDIVQKELLVTSIHVNKHGELEKWPKGFFDQKQADLRELMRINCR